VAIIETAGLTKAFDKLVAVNDLTLSIEEGEIFGLLGPNGAGKTTTISMLCTLLTPTRGTATVNGYDILQEPAAVRRSVGIVFQDPTLDTVLTGRENMELHARLYNVPRGLAKQRIDELLAVVDLSDRGDDITKKYSGGMRRRLELARGLIHHPKILFLDEPTLGLDPQTRQHIWRYIREMARQEGTTIILTTHYMEEADELCNRVGIIDHGRIMALDTPKGLKGQLGGDVVRLRLREPRTDGFRDLSFVREVELQGNVLRLTVVDAERNLATLLARARDVESVEVRTPTLDDVFLHYTGHEIRAEEGAGGWMESVVQYRSRGR